MARRRGASPIALPWEQGGSRLRALVAPARWRVALVLVALALCLLGLGHGMQARRREQRTRAVIAQVRRALSRFRGDFGRCPHSMRELVHPARAGVRYLRQMPVDGWGRPLWVRCPGRYDPDDVDVVSAGPSGNFLDDDNIQ